jgi:hypothetical protein
VMQLSEFAGLPWVEQAGVVFGTTNKRDAHKAVIRTSTQHFPRLRLN